MPSTIFSLVGAREHYAPMVMAERAGWLSCFVTDLWSPWGSTIAPFATRLGLDQLGRLAGRYSPGIPSHKVRSLARLGLKYKWMRARAKTREETYSVFERAGSEFARATRRFIFDCHDTFFGYSSTSLEALEYASKRGLRTVVDQIDPCRIEYQIVADEERRFPHLSHPLPSPPESYFSRISQEWHVASAIVVNSHWSKEALIQQGAPKEKIFVVPLAYQRPAARIPTRSRRRELRVLWLGTLCLRKGLPYALGAAERLARFPVRFTFAGSCDVNSANLKLPPSARYVGPITRAAVPRLYGEHDVFIFPTLSDGFGLTQIEALAHGLPVLATSCCGEVVEDGKSGFVVSPRDSRSLSDSLLRFLDEPDLLPTMSHNAVKRSEHFHPDVIWPSYAAALDRENFHA